MDQDQTTTKKSSQGAGAELRGRGLIGLMVNRF